MDIQSLAVGSLFGILAGFVGAWLSNQSRLYQRNAELKYENAELKKRILDLQNEVADFKEREAERIAQEAHKRDHCRDEQQVAILKLLDPHEGKRLCDIAKQFDLSEKAAIYHLRSLSNDGFVKSSGYSEAPHLETMFYEPSNSRWTIQQLGLAYLAKNKLLEPGEQSDATERGTAG